MHISYVFWIFPVNILHILQLISKGSFPKVWDCLDLRLQPLTHLKHHRTKVVKGAWPWVSMTLWSNIWLESLKGCKFVRSKVWHCRCVNTAPNSVTLLPGHPSGFGCQRWTPQSLGNGKRSGQHRCQNMQDTCKTNQDILRLFKTYIKQY